MELIIYSYICMLGLVFGSFMSVIVFRLDEKEGIVNGRSECPKCLVRLKWYDLIPIFSFLSMRGRCRYCREKIPFVYPVMELSTATSFILYFWINGLNFGPETFYELTLLFILLALVFFDYLYLILPDKMIFAGLIVALIYTTLFKPDFWISGSMTGLGLSAFFAIIYLVSRGEWMGFGDVKLAFFIGFILGFPMGLLSMISSVWLGALWGMGMMVISRANLKTALPFGSFICVVAMLFIIFNDRIRFLLPGI